MLGTFEKVEKAEEGVKREVRRMNEVKEMEEKRKVLVSYLLSLVDSFAELLK